MGIRKGYVAVGSGATEADVTPTLGSVLSSTSGVLDTDADGVIQTE